MPSRFCLPGSTTVCERAGDSWLVTVAGLVLTFSPLEMERFLKNLGLTAF